MTTDPEDLREDLRAEFARPKRYRYSCSDRMCGAMDCENCYGSSAVSPDDLTELVDRPE